MGHLRRFSYEPKIPFVEIEPGRLIVIVINIIMYITPMVYTNKFYTYAISMYIQIKHN